MRTALAGLGLLTLVVASPSFAEESPAAAEALEHYPPPEPLVEALRKGDQDEAFRLLNEHSPAAGRAAEPPEEPRGYYPPSPRLDFRMSAGELLGLPVFVLYPNYYQLPEEKDPVREKLARLLGEEKRLGIDQRPFKNAALLTAAARVKDPALRVVLFDAAGDKAKAREEVQVMAAAKDTPPASLLIAAAWLSENHSEDKVLPLVKRASVHPQAEPWRRWIEGCLLLLDPSYPRPQPPAPPESTTAHLVVPDTEPEPVFTGVQSDPEKIILLRIPPLDLHGGYRPPRYANVRLPVGIAPRESLANMAQTGRKEEAAAALFRAVIREVKLAVKQKKSADLPLAGAADIAAQLHLQDELVKAAEADDAAAQAFPSDFDRRRTVAILQCLLGKEQSALPELRELHRERPRDLTVAGALVKSLPEEERNSWRSLMIEGKLPQEDLLPLFRFDDDSAEGLPTLGGIRQAPDRNEKAYPRANQALLNLTSYLDHLEPSGEEDRIPEWINSWAGEQWDYYYRSRNIDQPRTALRLSLLQALMASMLRHPQTCRAGLRELESHLFLIKADAAGRSRQGEEFLKATLQTRLRFWDYPSFTDSTPHEETPSDSPYDASKGPYNDPEEPPRYGIPHTDLPLLRKDDPLCQLARRVAAGGFPGPVMPSEEDLFKGRSLPSDETLRLLLKITKSPGIEEFKAWKANSSLAPDQRRHQTSALVMLAILHGRSDLLSELQKSLASEILDWNYKKDSLWISPLLAAGIIAHPSLQERDKAMRQTAIAFLGPEESWPVYLELGPGERQIGTGRRLYLAGLGRLLRAQSLSGAISFARFQEAYGFQELLPVGKSFYYEEMISDPELLTSGIFANDTSDLEARKDYFHALHFARERKDKEKDPGEVPVDAEFLTSIEGPQRMWARLACAYYRQDTALAVSEMTLNLPAMKKWTPKARRDFSAFVAWAFPTAGDEAPAGLKEFLKQS